MCINNHARELQNGITRHKQWKTNMNWKHIHHYIKSEKWRVAKYGVPYSEIVFYISPIPVHAHTHVVFYGLRGLSIGVMVFILYKLYVLLPYTYPTPKLSPHRRQCISIFPQKNSLCMIYKRFKLWGHWKCPHKSPSPCNTYVMPCHYTNLCPHKPHKHAHTHTETHTHAYTQRDTHTHTHRETHTHTHTHTE